MRRQLEDAYPEAWVGGEISSFQLHPGSGHAYFTLKDHRAKLNCVMWRDNLRHLRFRPQRGMEVILRGRVTIYERGGQLQMNVLGIEPQGLGALMQEFEQRLKQLRQEGLTENKRPLPAHPRTIGVVTSKGSAALRDVLRTILRRDPAAHVVISGAQVQGRSSAFSIAQAIERLDHLKVADVVILARGGGSTEELWAFNEEPVARAIRACSVPVVTGIGHETDTTIADYVADVRASTPTAAAEHAVPVQAQVVARVSELERRLEAAFSNRIDQLGRRLLFLEKRLLDPTPAIAKRLIDLERRLGQAAPDVRLSRVRAELEQRRARLDELIDRRIAEAERRYAILVGRLESLSPLAVLSRGYAIVQTEDGAVLRRAADAEPDERLEIRLAEGRLAVRVEGEVNDE